MEDTLLMPDDLGPQHGEPHPLLAGAPDDLLLREPLCTPDR